jgi:hypothetical protein
MKFDPQTYRLTDTGSFGKRALLVGLFGLALSAIGWIVDPHRFFHAYLVAICFWVAIALGALFFTMLHHLVGARWSVVIRRLSESVMMTLPYLAVLFIPLLFGFHSLYHWSHPEAVAADELLMKKAGYLNTPFFVVRTLFCFTIWSLLARYLYNLSIKQDKGFNQTDVDKMKRVSAIGMIVFALTVTVAAWDWLMSLDSHWYSTIFGVNYFSAGLVTAISLFAIIAIILRKNGILSQTITVEHYHDLGKLMFAFTIFWTYVNFSQYFLIWYGNIPEETVWYLNRWEGSWKIASLVLLFGHFVIPFIVLMFRNSKRNLPILASVGILIVLMHYVEMYWLVYPTFSKQGVSANWLEPVPLIGIGGVFFWAFWMRFSKQPLVPINDPKRDASIHHVNPF